VREVGIGSVSLTPDSLLDGLARIVEAEKQMEEAGIQTGRQES